MKQRSWILPVCFLALATALIAAGLMGEGHLAVMRKAVRICLECIGIG